MEKSFRKSSGLGRPDNAGLFPSESFNQIHGHLLMGWAEFKSARHSGMRHLAQTSDAQLRIGESRDSPICNCTSWFARFTRAPE
jgi:hypothetical protein